MTTLGLGDLAQSFGLRQQNLALKATMTRLSNELTTGHVADTALRTSGDLTPINGLDASLARIGGYTAITNEISMFAGAMQTALSSIETMSSDLAAALISVSTGGSAQQVDAVAAEAEQKLAATVSLYNSRFGDRSLFAGVATNAQAMIDTESLLTTLAGVVNGASGPEEIERRLSDWFEGDSGFATTGYLGGAPMSSLPISAGDEVAITVTANDPSVRATLTGLAMAALLDRGLLAGNSVDRLDLARRAGAHLLDSQADRVNLAARIGLAEARIDSASVRNSNEAASLQIARNTITGVDQYEAASKLQESQTQLEMLYSLTARMTRLSLLDYMR